jgi:hypothetical protein
MSYEIQNPADLFPPLRLSLDPLFRPFRIYFIDNQQYSNENSCLCGTPLPDRAHRLGTAAAK